MRHAAWRTATPVDVTPKAGEPRPVRVAAAVIRRDDGAVLLARRHPEAHQGGLWEFPGGKLEPRERVVDALARELREELGIDIDGAIPLIRIRHAYPDKLVDIATLEVRAWHGEAHGREGQLVRWVMPGELAGYRFPAANLPILAAALLPRVAVVVDVTRDSAEGCLGEVDACLAAGAGLVRLRLAASGSAGAYALGRELVTLCHRRGALLLLEGRAPDALAIGADGVHLAPDAPVTGDSLPPTLRVSVEVQAPADLARAARLGADFAFAGSSEPQVLEALAFEAAMPLYAPVPRMAEPALVAAAATQLCRAGCQGIALRGAQNDGLVPAISSARAALSDDIVFVTYPGGAG